MNLIFSGLLPQLLRMNLIFLSTRCILVIYPCIAQVSCFRKFGHDSESQRGGEDMSPDVDSYTSHEKTAGVILVTGPGVVSEPAVLLKEGDFGY
jgi:hypothetical protein